jgi:hypothetical protein
MKLSTKLFCTACPARVALSLKQGVNGFWQALAETTN